MRSRRTSSMQSLVDLLQSGKVVQRRLTMPEGMTTAEALELVRKTEALTGEITLDVKEGDLLPETYFYSRDDTRDGLLLRMKEAMEKALDEAWRKRLAGLPLANRREALILASIIEKETGLPAERTKVAAVFINRLRRRMRLESDPTVIYGFTGGKGTLQPRAHARRPAIVLAVQHLSGRPACRRGPICNPGRASIMAATNPARDRSLYFVADGQGGHACSPPTSWSTIAMSSAGGRSSAERQEQQQQQQQRQQQGQQQPGQPVVPTITGAPPAPPRTPRQ